MSKITELVASDALSKDANLSKYCSGKRIYSKKKVLRPFNSKNAQIPSFKQVTFDGKGIDQILQNIEDNDDQKIENQVKTEKSLKINGINKAKHASKRNNIII